MYTCTWYGTGTDKYRVTKGELNMAHHTCIEEWRPTGRADWTRAYVRTYNGELQGRALARGKGGYFDSCWLWSAGHAYMLNENAKWGTRVGSP